MAARRRQTGGRLVSLAALPPPRGGPAALYAASRVARLREELGADLARHLVGARWEDGTLVLELAGSGWERALAADLPVLTERLRQRLASPRLQLRVLSRPDVEVAAEPRRRGAGARREGSGSERLRALARRLMARRGIRRVDSGPEGK
ncbi:MAG: DciA family protein [Acidobacteriota bacterium]|nr:DciA family protein [Acidobacteriota bacterium]